MEIIVKFAGFVLFEWLVDSMNASCWGFDWSVTVQSPIGVCAVYCSLIWWCICYYDTCVFLIKFCVHCMLRHLYVESHMM